MGLWQDITGVTAAREAAAQQQAGLEQGIDVMQQYLDPYAQAGEGALGQMQALSGAMGPEAQQAAYDAIQGSAGFQSALQQGERGILQNAAATGGVRGGNTQGALAQYSPALLSQAIDQRYSQLGGIANMGANAAGNLASGVGSALGQAGQAQAAATLGEYNMQRGFVGDVFGGLMGLGNLGIGIAGLF